MKAWLLPRLIWIVYGLLSRSWRVSLVEPDSLKRLLEQKTPIIFAHWHGDELAIIHMVPHYKIATMTSTSQDGSLVDFVIRKMGGATSRGSSTRGGIAALKGLIRLIRQGYRASMAVDGPKGPLHRVKPGVFELSRIANAYVVPVGVAASNGHVFQKSWNKALLPWPFSRVVITFSEPLSPITESALSREPELAQTLASSIANANQQASKLIAEI